MAGVSWGNFRSLLSWHYYTEAGEPLFETIGDLCDEAVQRAREAMRCWFPSVAPSDALVHCADARNLDYPVSRMANIDVRGYLADPWGKWEHSGTRGRILEELALLGLTNALIVSWRDLADGGEPLAFGGDQSCWFLRIKKPHPWTPARRWDAATSIWDAQDHYWDFGPGHDPELLLAVKRIIKKWKPAASSCRYIEIWLNAAVFPPMPIEIVRVPVWEDWEFDARGQAVSYYNGGYLQR